MIKPLGKVITEAKKHIFYLLLIESHDIMSIMSNNHI